ncbi:hypothetical protein [Chryseobacterium sp. c4a]|uniref:hypothetical protein n=1 Tax=Chryseobacterium sp. c4a TaxID=1573582 RepID=UPI00135B28B5|nr:hypothetical protein [Chryseobacterium sp. c4a]
MKNLIESKEYTIGKKTEQIGRLQSHYSQSIAEIQEFLDGKKSAVAVTSGLEYLSVWYHWNFIEKFLKENKVDYELLSNSTLFGIESNNVRYFLGKKVETYRQALQFDKAIKHLAQGLLLGWDEIAIKYGHVLIEMLYGKQYNGWNPAYKHVWFMLELFCKWQGIELDQSKLNSPDDLAPYNKALEHWDTKDLNLLAQLVDELSIFHIEQSDEDEYKDRTPDFASSDYFVFAIEIVLWLNIRSRLGLPKYQPNNDLMQLTINSWHLTPQIVPQIELLKESKYKLLQDYPGIDFEI